MTNKNVVLGDCEWKMTMILVVDDKVSHQTLLQWIIIMIEYWNNQKFANSFPCFCHSLLIESSLEVRFNESSFGFDAFGMCVCWGLRITSNKHVFRSTKILSNCSEFEKCLVIFWMVFLDGIQVLFWVFVRCSVIWSHTIYIWLD